MAALSTRDLGLSRRGIVRSAWIGLLTVGERGWASPGAEVRWQQEDSSAVFPTQGRGVDGQVDCSTAVPGLVQVAVVCQAEGRRKTLDLDCDTGLQPGGIP
jgi:hypothetical protein